MSWATFGPMPGVSAISSGEASASASIVAEALGEVAAGHAADALDAHAEQHAAERHLGLRALDALDEPLRGRLADAVDLDELLGRQAGRSRRRSSTSPARWRTSTCFSPRPSMSIAPSETKCLSSCQRRAGAQAVRALGEDLALGLDRRRAARRAVARRLGRRRAVGPLDRVRRGRDDLRDDVAGARDDDLVALADVLAPQVLLVVQRRHLHGHAADVHGLELRRTGAGRRTCRRSSGSAERRDLRRRRELPRDRPARVAADGAEPALQLEVVDLDHDAVDLEVQRAAAALPRQALLDDLLLVVEADDVVVDREAALLQPRQRLGVLRERQALGAADRVAPTGSAGARRRAWGRAGGSSPPPRCAGS